MSQKEISKRIARVESQLGFSMPLCNFMASGTPSINDDGNKGYGAGSMWIYGGDVFICTDNTTTAAVWVQINN